MTDDERDDLIEDLRELRDLLPRMMTLLEDHVARLERLEYHVLGLQPAPPMLTARRDH